MRIARTQRFGGRNASTGQNGGSTLLDRKRAFSRRLVLVAVRIVLWGHAQVRMGPGCREHVAHADSEAGVQGVPQLPPGGGGPGGGEPDVPRKRKISPSACIHVIDVLDRIVMVPKDRVRVTMPPIQGGEIDASVSHLRTR